MTLSKNTVWFLALGSFGVPVPTTFTSDSLNMSGGRTRTYPHAMPLGNPKPYYNPVLKTLPVENWIFGIDQPLALRTTPSPAYVGSRGCNLDLGSMKNTAVVPGPGDAATAAARKFFPYITPTEHDEGSLVHQVPFGRNRSFSSSSGVVSALTSGLQIDAITTQHFGIPYDGVYQGDLCRNYLRPDWRRNFDFAPVLASLGNVLSGSKLEVVTSTVNAPLQLQLALRLLF